MIDAISSIEEIPDINSVDWDNDTETSKFLAIDYKVCCLHIFIGASFSNPLSNFDLNLKLLKDFDFVNTYFTIDDDWFAPHQIRLLKNFNWAVEPRSTYRTNIKDLNQIIKDLFQISKLAVFM